MRETVLKFFSLLISKFAFAFIITTLLTGIILIPFVIKNTYKINQAPKPLLDIVPTKIITKTPTATPSPTLKPIPSNIIAPTSPPVVINNVAPGSGYNRQTVAISEGNFIVDIIAADLNTTRVIVDTASDSDCFDNCPVLPLSDYVSRSGGFAGINGTYFCPASYPSCAGKVNSFDLLVMNKNKYYFNSSNNVYSTNPAVIFYGNSVRFVGKALEWGRDTGVDAVISNFPLSTSPILARFCFEPSDFWIYPSFFAKSIFTGIVPPCCEKPHSAMSWVSGHCILPVINPGHGAIQGIGPVFPALFFIKV